MPTINYSKPYFTRMIMATLKDPQVTKLEQQVKQLEQVVKVLSGKIEFLERENRRRGQEVNQIASVLRKG